jgi:hypothetical protein
MKLDDLILKNEDIILDTWVEHIFKIYSPEVSKFFIRKKDQFQNPVGFIISEKTKKIFNELIRSSDFEKLVYFLDDIIKIKSVQPLIPSKALAFLFELKTVIRNCLFKDIKKYNLFDDLIDLEYKIDKLALIAFDSYMNTREKLFHIKIKEAKNVTYNLIEKLNKNQKTSEQEFLL